MAKKHDERYAWVTGKDLRCSLRKLTKKEIEELDRAIEEEEEKAQRIMKYPLRQGAKTFADGKKDPMEW